MPVHHMVIPILRGALVAAIAVRLTHDFRVLDTDGVSRDNAAFAATLAVVFAVGQYIDAISGACLAFLVVMGQVSGGAAIRDK